MWRTLTRERPGGDDPGDSRRAVEWALASPEARDLVAEAKRVLPELEAAVIPAGEEAIRLTLQKLAVTFGSSGRDGRHWNAYADEFIECLADQPLEALLKGARDYRDDPNSRLFPFPGVLKGRCDPHATKLRIALYRARLLAAAEERAAPPPPTPEELAERKRQVEETRKMMGLKTIPEARPAPEREPSPREAMARIADDLERRKADPIRRPPAQDSELFS